MDRTNANDFRGPSGKATTATTGSAVNRAKDRILGKRTKKAVGR